MYDHYENPIDRTELIICEKCTHVNLVAKRVLERRDQRNHHVSLEDAVFKKWKKFAVDLGCDLNEALIVMFHKIENKEDKTPLLTNLNDVELLEEEE